MWIAEVNPEALDMKYAWLSVRRPAAERKLLAWLSESGQQRPVIAVPGGEAGRFVVVDGHRWVRGQKRLVMARRFNFGL